MVNVVNAVYQVATVIFNFLKVWECKYKELVFALATWLSRLEHCPRTKKLKVWFSGHMPGLGSHSGCMGEATNQCFSLTLMSLSVSLSLSLSLLSQINENISLGEGLKKRGRELVSVLGYGPQAQRGFPSGSVILAGCSCRQDSLREICSGEKGGQSA